MPSFGIAMGPRMSDARPTLIQIIRRVLGRLRAQTTHAASFASRFNAVTRYALDLILWSRIFSRSTDVARFSHAMAERGVEHAAPALFISGPMPRAHVWEQGFAEVYRLLLANLQPPDLISSIRYARPSPAFQGIYLWDSAFIAQVWEPWDTRVALDVCRAVVANERDGRLPHVIAHFVESGYTQPPLIAWSLWRLFDSTGSEADRQHMAAAYPVLKRYADWLDDQRCLDNGTYFWAHPYESGIENAPRFGNRDESVLVDTTNRGAPDLTAYIMLQSEALARMAAEVGRTHDVQPFRDRWTRTRDALNQQLWHDGDGLYYDRGVGGSWVRSVSIACLLPLWAGAPDDVQARRIVERIADPKAFNTLIPLPSVAANDPDFDRDMWRGCTWLNTAYAMVLGLERYGEDQLAADLAYRLVDGVYQTHGNHHRVYEFYDPHSHRIDQLHRKRGNRWKKFTLGDKPRGEFVGWTGLVNTLLLEHVLGLRRERGGVVLRPRLPEAMRGCGYIVRLPVLGCVYEVEASPDGYARGSLRTEQGVRRFELAFGESCRADDLPLESEAIDACV